MCPGQGQNILVILWFSSLKCYLEYFCNNFDILISYFFYISCWIKYILHGPNLELLLSQNCYHTPIFYTKWNNNFFLKAHTKFWKPIAECWSKVRRGNEIYMLLIVAIMFCLQCPWALIFLTFIFSGHSVYELCLPISDLAAHNKFSLHLEIFTPIPKY